MTGSINAGHPPGAFVFAAGLGALWGADSVRRLFGPREAPEKPKGLIRVVLFLVVLITSLALRVKGVTTWGLTLTIIGLAFDIVGAMTLAAGLLFVDMARIRHATEGGVYVPARGLQRIARFVGNQWGSSEPQDTEAYTVEELTETLAGVALLIIGFACQAVGALLGATSKGGLVR